MKDLCCIVFRLALVQVNRTFSSLDKTVFNMVDHDCQKWPVMLQNGSV